MEQLQLHESAQFPALFALLDTLFTSQKGLFSQYCHFTTELETASSIKDFLEPI